MPKAKIRKKTTKKVVKKSKVKRKKTTKKRIPSKMSARKVVKKSKAKKSKKAEPIWTSHVDKMQTRIDDALKKLEKDIKRKAPYKIIEQDNNELLMILGECNYIVREFHEHLLK